VIDLLLISGKEGISPMEDKSLPLEPPDEPVTDPLLAGPSVGEGMAPPLEKPENGIAGLKHWRHDLVAGLVV
jgi:hypothetical protein